MTVGYQNVTISGVSHKSYITFTFNNINTSTTPTILQQLVWPLLCFTNPLSQAPSAALASISNPALMCYSGSNLVANGKFQGPWVSPTNQGGNTPIVNASNTSIWLDLTFKGSANLGGSVTNYLIQTGDNNGSTTFLGAFIYITFNNAVLI